MEEQVHFKCMLHMERPAPGRYREISVGEQTDGFELLMFEGSLLRSDQLASVPHDWQSVSFPPTRDAACVAAYTEMRKSVAAGGILVQSVER